MSYAPISTIDNVVVRLGVVSTGTMSNGSAAFVDAGGLLNLTAADIGAPILVISAVPEANGALRTTILTVADATHCTLADSATQDTDATSNVILFRERGRPLTAGVSVTHSLTTHDVAKVTFKDSLARPVVRQPVLITVLGTHDFGGTIDNVRGFRIPGATITQWDLDCVSWDKWIYRRQTGEPTTTSGSPAVSNPFNGVFSSLTVKQIFQYLITHSLSSDGIDFDSGSVDGPVIPEFSVSYAQCGDTFDQLVKSGSTGSSYLHWFTDPLKTVHLADQTTVAAPWDVSDTQSPQSLQAAVTCIWDRSEYVNRAYVRLGSFITAATPTGFVGDSSSRTFNLPLAVALAPTITLNASPQTVGILGVDTGKDWYWNKGSTTITQDNSGTILTPSDTLIVTAAQFDTSIVLSQNDAAVDESSAIESGTGYYESVQQTNVPSTQTDGQTLAAAIAAQYGVIPKRLEASTYRPGLKIGMQQHVTIAAYDLDSDFVIDSLTITTDENLILWSYTAVGSPLIDWDYRATLARLRPGGGDALGSAGNPAIPWNAIAVLPGAQVVAADVTANHRRTTVNLDGSQVNLTHAYITAKVAPVTQSLIADWLVSSDNGVTWNSIFPTGSANKVVLPIGASTATIAPSAWAVNPLREGFLSRIDVLQADGICSGVEIELYGGIS